MKVFVTNYHISVNKTLVDDLHAIGLEVIMPSRDFEKTHIDFFAPNDEHSAKAKLVSYSEFMQMPALVIIIPCIQLVNDFMKLYKDRGERDVLVYLTANSNSIEWFDPNKTDYVMSHDLGYHRQFDGKYKILYFNRPTMLIPKKNQQELERSFEEKKVKLYINNFDKDGYEPEYAAAIDFQQKYEARTGWRVPFYGYEMPDGWPSMQQTQSHMVDSMFSLVFKRRETWGQMVNESMLLGTPCVFLKEFINSTFTQYLINQETAIVGETVDELIESILALSYEQYASLVNESYFQSQMFCNDENRRGKLEWLFDKVSHDIKFN